MAMVMSVPINQIISDLLDQSRDGEQKMQHDVTDHHCSEPSENLVNPLVFHDQPPMSRFEKININDLNNASLRLV